MPSQTAKEVHHAVDMLEAGVMLAMPLSRPLTGISSGLHELRFRDSVGQVRIFYLLKKGDAIYLVHAFRKKTRQMPHKEIEVVLKRIKLL
ncbi:MAG: type II toxin-antitoxin system RelE/ParE family toxin [Nitrospinae bacterium]|nr:type II toxin-antitoxin system RelE/ParE family toxin [Nitrospinota bacterium]